MTKRLGFLSTLVPLKEIGREPDLVIGSGNERHFFSLGVGPHPGGFILAVDTIYGTPKLYRDEAAIAVLYHEVLAVIASDKSVYETRFVGTVFDIVDFQGEHYLEMELGCARLDRGFSVTWVHEVPDIVNEMRFAGPTIELDLFEGGRSVVNAVSGQEISFRWS
jgi:hypothetical protein